LLQLRLGACEDGIVPTDGNHLRKECAIGPHLVFRLHKSLVSFAGDNSPCMTMRETDEFTIGRVFPLLPKVLGQESISLWLYLGSFTALVNFLRLALEQGPRGTSTGGGMIIFILSIIGWMAASLVHCAAIQAADRRLSGMPVPAIDALRASFTRLWPYLGLSVLLSLALTIGLLALIVPGIFLLVAFSLALPALVTRRTGVFDSLSISWRMTKGRRLEILGLLLVYGLAVALVFAAAILLGIIVLYLTGLAGTFGQKLIVLFINAFLPGLVLVAGGAVSATMFRLIEVDAAAVPS